MISIHVVVAILALAFLVGMMQYVSRKEVQCPIKNEISNFIVVDCVICSAPFGHTS